jgi:hypothetical protein
MTLLLVLFTLAGCAGASQDALSNEEAERVSAAPSADVRTDAQSARHGAVTISFDYAKQSGHASNQFAVWIEDAAGECVKTLYATRFTAEGGYRNRPDSIPLWVERSGLADMSDERIDAITGATPKTGPLEYVWDLTDENGNPMPDGTYKFFVEASLRWKNRVLCSGEIAVGGTPTTAEAPAAFSYEASDGQSALTADAPENGMIGTVRAAYVPAEFK